MTATIPCRPWTPADPPIAVVVDNHDTVPDGHRAVDADTTIVEVLQVATDGTAYVEDDVHGGWVPVACLYRPVSDDPWPTGWTLGPETT